MPQSQLPMTREQLKLALQWGRDKDPDITRVEISWKIRQAVRFAQARFTPEDDPREFEGDQTSLIVDPSRKPPKSKALSAAEMLQVEDQEVFDLVGEYQSEMGEDGDPDRRHEIRTEIGDRFLVLLGVLEEN